MDNYESFFCFVLALAVGRKNMEDESKKGVGSGETDRKEFSFQSLEENKTLKVVELGLIANWLENIRISQNLAGEMKTNFKHPLLRLSKSVEYGKRCGCMDQQCHAIHWTNDVQNMRKISSSLNGNGRRPFNLVNDLNRISNKLDIQSDLQVHTTKRINILSAEQLCPSELLGNFVNKIRTFSIIK
jgi:hypothetical protein